MKSRSKSLKLTNLQLADYVAGKSMFIFVVYWLLLTSYYQLNVNAHTAYS